MTVEELKMADYFDETNKLIRFTDFVVFAKWNLVTRPMFCMLAFWHTEIKLEVLSLKRKNRTLQFKIDALRSRYEQ